MPLLTRKRRTASVSHNSGYSASRSASRSLSISRRDLPPHTTLVPRKKLHPFLFMGCWNYTSPKPRGSDARDAVLEALQADEDASLLVVAGDNAYPNKASKPYVFTMDHIGPGFKKLKDTAKQLLVGIGNHNAERLNAGDHRILQVEQETFGSSMPNPYFCRLFPKERYALVFIDTNSFEESDIEALNERYTSDVLSEMVEWLEGVLIYLKKHKYNYYLVQHEPFFGLKQKKGREQTVLLNKGHLVLDILALHRCYPEAVLSAHIHNYQEWDLSYKGGPAFRQIVAGTGGAKPDAYPALQTMKEGASHPVAGTPFSSIHYKTPEKYRDPNYGYLFLKKPGVREFCYVTKPTINFRTDT